MTSSPARPPLEALPTPSPEAPPATGPAAAAPLEGLNPAQQRAAAYGVAPGRLRSGPLLVIAGAGSGKTRTLAHRVAHLVRCGADPGRVLLLTFTRRAAAEMTRRARRVAGPALGPEPLAWSGTFHGVANRLLRLEGRALGLDPAFTVLDRADAEDLLDLVRAERGLAARAKRFPRKGTCLAIYSHTINARESLEQTLEDAFPWCASACEELRGLFAAYTERKQRHHVLDYDDLLLYWSFGMRDAAFAARVRDRFDHVLVDEYQDTNALQAEILLALRPDGSGLTVVGDDAQSIYSFRAADVRNILDFPAGFAPPAEVIALEQSYRATTPLLEACNAVIERSPERHAKRLFSERRGAERPFLVTAEDEDAQVEYVVERVLEYREQGLPLHRQAVLMRSGHHSDRLELELARREIPYHKYGGLRFLEAAHVKDVLCVLRWAENSRDAVAAFRVLQLLPGVGPAHARRALEHVEAAGHRLGALPEFAAPPACREEWPALCGLYASLCEPGRAWAGQVGEVARWYRPHLERRYDGAAARASDIDQLDQISTTYRDRDRFLAELTLDPPDATSDRAGPPHLDEDYLVLSTIHSAKGQEWDAVFVLDASDGAIPSDLATGSPARVEEERRLLYVAMTRARDHLHLVHPLRYAIRQQRRHGDRHVYAPRTRFVPDELLDRFAQRHHGRPVAVDAPGAPGPRVDVGAELRALWAPPKAGGP